MTHNFLFKIPHTWGTVVTPLCLAPDRLPKVKQEKKEKNYIMKQIFSKYLSTHKCVKATSIYNSMHVLLELEKWGSVINQSTQPSY